MSVSRHEACSTARSPARRRERSEEGQGRQAHRSPDGRQNDRPGARQDVPLAPAAIGQKRPPHR